MSKIIREVGFLALGIVALLEVFIYGRWWAWGEHSKDALWAAGCILLQGLHFASDGAAWSDLWHRVSGLPATAGPKTYYQKLAKRWSKGWCIDFAAFPSGSVFNSDVRFDGDLLGIFWSNT